MREGIYSIFDAGAESASEVFQARTEIVAKRRFSHAVKDSPFKKDLFLLQIGYIDVNDIDPCQSVLIPEAKRVCNALEIGDIGGLEDEK